MFHPDISQMPEAIPADSLSDIPLDCLLNLFNVTDILMDSDNITIDKFGQFTPQDPRITLRFNAAPRVRLLSMMNALRQMPCVAPQGGTFQVQQYGGRPAFYGEGRLELRLTGHMDCQNCRRRPA